MDPVINFREIPLTRTPGTYVEFDNSLALSGLLELNQKYLLIGQRNTNGTTAEGELVRVVSNDDADAQFGRGSMLAEMCRAAREVNMYSEMWAVALDDLAAGVAATKTVTIGGTIGTGILAMMIGGQRVQVKVSPTATADTDAVAAALVAAVNADDTLQMSASAALSVVTLTAKHKGEVGQNIDVRHSYYVGEKLPPGLTVTIAAGTAGAGNPDIATALAAISDVQFHYFGHAYIDAANLNALEAELANRFGPMQAIEGIAFSAVNGSVATMGTFGNSRNSQHSSIMAAGLSPTRPEIWAACYAARAAYDLNIDPGLPLQTQALYPLLPAALADRPTQPERDTLLYDGVSTHKVDSGGVVRIDRAITTYQKNAQGVVDPSYLDVNTMASLAFLRLQIVARMSYRYPRHHLADDTFEVKPGQSVVTPKMIKNELVALYRELMDRALVEDIEGFTETLNVVRNSSDRSRVDCQMRPRLIGQMRTLAVQVQFIL
jgi:phage tail sheath gpL-like